MAGSTPVTLFLCWLCSLLSACSCVRSSVLCLWFVQANSIAVYDMPTDTFASVKTGFFGVIKSIEVTPIALYVGVFPSSRPVVSGTQFPVDLPSLYHVFVPQLFVCP